MRHPINAEPCKTPQEKTDAYAAAYVFSCPAGTPEESTVRAEARTDLTAERDCPTYHAVLDAVFTEEPATLDLHRQEHRKAAGADGLPVELLKFSGTSGVRAVTKLFNALYDIG